MIGNVWCTHGLRCPCGPRGPEIFKGLRAGRLRETLLWPPRPGPCCQDSASAASLHGAGLPPAVELLRLLPVPPAVDLAAQPRDVGREGFDILDVLPAEDRKTGPQVGVEPDLVRLDRVSEEAAKDSPSRVPIGEDNRILRAATDRLREVENRHPRIQPDDLAGEPELPQGFLVTLALHDHRDRHVRLDEILNRGDKLRVDFGLVQWTPNRFEEDGGP